MLSLLGISYIFTVIIDQMCRSSCLIPKIKLVCLDSSCLDHKFLKIPQRDVIYCNVQQINIYGKDTGRSDIFSSLFTEVLEKNQIFKGRT